MSQDGRPVRAGFGRRESCRRNASPVRHPGFPLIAGGPLSGAFERLVEADDVAERFVDGLDGESEPEPRAKQRDHDGEEGAEAGRHNQESERESGDDGGLALRDRSRKHLKTKGRPEWDGLEDDRSGAPQEGDEGAESPSSARRSSRVPRDKSRLTIVNNRQTSTKPRTLRGVRSRTFHARQPSCYACRHEPASSPA